MWCLLFMSHDDEPDLMTNVYTFKQSRVMFCLISYLMRTNPHPELNQKSKPP